MKEDFFILVQWPYFNSRSCTKIFLLLFLLTAGAPILPDRALAAAMDPGLSEYLEKFHGHTCAGSLMGARLGLTAKAALKAAGGEGKLKAKYFNHSCPVDGVQVAVGTTYGNRAIEVEDKKQHLGSSHEKSVSYIQDLSPYPSRLLLEGLRLF